MWANSGLGRGGPEERGRDGTMTLLFFILFVGLEVKHFVADYFLQPGWVLAGKGSFAQPGGYVHGKSVV